MPKLETYSSRVFERGIVQGVDVMIAPKESVYMSNNIVYDKSLGAGVIRDGTAYIGAQVGAGQKCLGYHELILSDGTKRPVAVFNNIGGTAAAIYYLSAGVWTITTVITLTVNLPCRFITFLNRIALTNGTDSVRASADGITWNTTEARLDTANFPKFETMIEYQDRVYGVLANSDRLVFSSTPVAGNISWTVNNGYIDIEPEDGGGTICALSKVPSYLLIAKERSLKRWNTQSTFPDDMVNLGTFRQESICVAKNSVFFMNKNGIYETNGGYPVLRSRPVQDIINAIDPTFYSSVSSISDSKHVEFSIGTIVIDEITYTNSALRYALETQQWEFRTYTKQPTVYGRYITSTIDSIAFGTTDGYIMQTDTGVSDPGPTMIPYSIQTQEIILGVSVNNIDRICVHTRGMYGSTLFVRADKGEFQIVGSIEDNNQLFESMGLVGTYFEFRLSGNSISNKAYFSGISIIDAESTAIFK